MVMREREEVERGIGDDAHVSMEYAVGFAVKGLLTRRSDNVSAVVAGTHDVARRKGRTNRYG